jgi:hypothetical protein
VSHTAQNQTNRPLPLDGGRVLEPGERAEIDPKSEHDKNLENEGKLLRINETPKEKN